MTSCDDSVVADLLQVETALIDEGCFLEIVSPRQQVAKVLSSAGLHARGDDCATPSDLSIIDHRLLGADGRVNRIAAAADALMHLVRPDMSNVQVVDPWDDSLKISTHHGFHQAFLSHFARVADDSSACGTAMRQRDLVTVTDVASSPIFVGTKALDVLTDAGVRAVESMPYFDLSDELVGVISMHHSTPGTRPKRDHMLLRLLAARLGALW